MMTHTNPLHRIQRATLGTYDGDGDTPTVAPASGATVYLWNSTRNAGKGWHLNDHYLWIRLVLYSSHNSATSGIIVQVSDSMVDANLLNTASTGWLGTVMADGAAATRTYTQATDLRAIYDIPVTSRHMRIHYANSANVLTAWEVDIYGIKGSRA